MFVAETTVREANIKTWGNHLVAGLGSLTCLSAESLFPWHHACDGWRVRFNLGCLDGVAMKPARCAGLTDARRQVEIVQNAGLMFLGSGLSDPDVSLAASLVLYGAYDLEYPAALNGPQFIDGSVLKQPFKVENGELAVPTGPGLGVEVDENKIEKYLVKI